MVDGKSEDGIETKIEKPNGEDISNKLKKDDHGLNIDDRVGDIISYSVAGIAMESIAFHSLFNYPLFAPLAAGLGGIMFVLAGVEAYKLLNNEKGGHGGKSTYGSKDA